jgi:hypothetical protein
MKSYLAKDELLELVLKLIKDKKEQFKYSINYNYLFVKNKYFK